VQYLHHTAQPRENWKHSWYITMVTECQRIISRLYNVWSFASKQQNFSLPINIAKLTGRTTLPHYKGYPQCTEGTKTKAERSATCRGGAVNYTVTLKAKMQGHREFTFWKRKNPPRQRKNSRSVKCLILHALTQ